MLNNVLTYNLTNTTMWIQTTHDITREEAERKWIHKKMIEAKEMANYAVTLHSNRELEEEIEEEFYNYNIIS